MAGAAAGPVGPSSWSTAPSLEPAPAQRGALHAVVLRLPLGLTLRRREGGLILKIENLTKE